jgi:heat shock protein HslJ
MSRMSEDKRRALHELRGVMGCLALLVAAAGCALDQTAGAGGERATVTGALAGQSQEPAAQPPLVGRGNEPGWSVTIGPAEIELVTDYGAKRTVFPKPPPEVSGHRTRYAIPERDVVITLVGRPCADTMSGMFYPSTVTVETAEGVLSGCGGEPASLLRGPEWLVDSIDGAGVIGGSRVTIAFGEDGRVVGSGSCNRYNAAYDLTGEGLSIGQAAATMMACAPALMEQERRFFDALAAVRRFEIAPDGALVLLADDGPKLRARR